MTFIEIQQELARILTQARSWHPPDKIESLLELTRAGEPGVALEIFCTQLTDADTPVLRPVWTRIQSLCREMGLADEYWESLVPLVRD